MKSLEHPNIIKLLDSYHSKNSYNLVLEFVNGKRSLNRLVGIQTDRRLSEKSARPLMRQLFEAVRYLHEKRVVHRDLKLDNVLVSPTGQVKLIDFGFSIRSQKSQRLKLFCGTPSYMAPELSSKSSYLGPPVDIWALGVILYRVLVGRHPFRGSSERELFLRVNRLKQIIPRGLLSPEAIDLINSLLTKSSASRPTIDEVIDHPWLIEPVTASQTIDLC